MSQDEKHLHGIPEKEFSGSKEIVGRSGFHKCAMPDCAIIAIHEGDRAELAITAGKGDDEVTVASAVDFCPWCRATLTKNGQTLVDIFRG